jgi:hypothetical protein
MSAKETLPASRPKSLRSYASKNRTSLELAYSPKNQPYGSHKTRSNDRLNGFIMVDKIGQVQVRGSSYLPAGVLGDAKNNDSDSRGPASTHRGTRIP